MRPQTVYVSATPGDWELQQTGGVFVEQVIRPTGLIDPICIIRPTESQVDDLIGECRDVAARGMRTLVTTLTKRMAEDLTDYLHEAGLTVRRSEESRVGKEVVSQGRYRGTPDHEKKKK